MITPGQQGVILSIETVSIHGDPYVDLVIADPDAPDDPSRALHARLGSEAIEGDVRVGDRVRVEGFLRMVTGVVRLE